MNQLHIWRDGPPEGPYPAAHIEAQLTAGTLAPDHRVSRDGGQTWMPAAEAVRAAPRSRKWWWFIGGGCGLLALTVVGVILVIVGFFEMLDKGYDAAYGAFVDPAAKERANRPRSDLYSYAAIWPNPAASETSVVLMPQAAPKRDQVLAVARLLARIYHANATPATVMIMDDREAAEQISGVVSDEAAVKVYLDARANLHLVGVATYKPGEEGNLETRKAGGNGWENTLIERSLPPQP